MQGRRRERARRADRGRCATHQHVPALPSKPVLIATLLTGALAACAPLVGCGSSASDATAGPAPTISPTAIPAPAQGTAATAPLQTWPEFGLDPQRSDSTDARTGITAANVVHLHHVHVTLPGTVDSSPVYLHGATVNGAPHDTIVVATSYGKVLAIDANSGQILWTFTPPGYGTWAGSPQFTATSPLLDPDGRYVYSASPNGLIHKLALADGQEVAGAGWPARVTLEPKREKLGAALNIDGPDLLVATSGYFGDIPPYQGHVALLDRASGKLKGVFNTLCSDRRTLLVPSTCPSSDSAILSRGGAVVEPGGKRILIDTGNGPWNGTTDFGDSVLELTFPGLDLRQSFTPTNQAHLNETDTDLGSSAPVLVGKGRVTVAGKDGIIRVLRAARLNGGPKRSHTKLGGEVQRLPLPGGGELFSAPAVWRHNRRTTMFVGAEHGTAAYVLRSGRLYEAWQNGTPGTSPVMAGGLLYVYDPSDGGVYVYQPGSSKPIARLPGSSGHWNSPIVVDGHVVEPEGNANDHATTGELEIFNAG